MPTEQQLDEPNKVRASQCPTCGKNLLICGIDHLDGKTIKEFQKYETKYGCKTTHITIREARTMGMCFNPGKCASGQTAA
jgi:hypothetical protein